MTLVEIKDILALAGSFGIGAIIAGVLFWFIVSHFIPAYLNEKAKNLAKLEDIEKITSLVEEVKHNYASQIQSLVHQNNLLLEEVKGKNQLRLAALDKRLQAHQEAFGLWRKMISVVHTERVSGVVMECQSWYNKSCLYLDSDSREAFISAYGALSNHQSILDARSDPQNIKENFSLILSAGDKIVKGAELPSLGQQETEIMKLESESPHKLTKGTPPSGSPY